MDRVAQFAGIVHGIGRQRADQRFMQRAEQRGGGQRGILRRQMPGTDRGVDPGREFPGDLAAARQPRRRDIDINRLGQDAPGQLALRQHMNRDRGVTAAASAEDGPGAASAARRIAASSSRETSAINSEIRSALDGK